MGYFSSKKYCSLASAMLFADTVLKYKNYAVLKQKASDKRFNIIRFFFGSEKFFDLIALCLMNIIVFLIT